MMQEIKISLPIPPSVNAAYANKTRGAGRVKTRRAVQFSVDALKSMYGLPKAIEEHITIMNSQKDELIRNYVRTHPGSKFDYNKMLLAAIWALPEPMKPSYHIEVDIYFKDRSIPRDIMNFEKLSVDFLVGRGLILDDCLIDVFTIRRGKVDKENPRMDYLIKIFARE